MSPVKRVQTPTFTRRTILAQERLEPFRFERHGHFAGGDLDQRGLQSHTGKNDGAQNEHGIGQLPNVVHVTFVARAGAQILKSIGKVKGNGCGNGNLIFHF